MPNTYQFAIKALKTYPEYNGKTNVVFAIDWTYTTTQNGKTAVLESTKPLDLENLDNFIEFSNITEAKALEWLENSFTEYGLSEMQKNLDRQIAGQEKIEQTPDLPWA